MNFKLGTPSHIIKTCTELIERSFLVNSRRYSIGLNKCGNMLIYFEKKIPPTFIFHIINFDIDPPTCIFYLKNEKKITPTCLFHPTRLFGFQEYAHSKQKALESFAIIILSSIFPLTNESVGRHLCSKYIVHHNSFVQSSLSTLVSLMNEDPRLLFLKILHPIHVYSLTLDYLIKKCPCLLFFQRFCIQLINVYSDYSISSFIGDTKVMSFLMSLFLVLRDKEKNYKLQIHSG